jgi:uncharacterized protein (TIGR02246 family)
MKRVVVGLIVGLSAVMLPVAVQSKPKRVKKQAPAAVPAAPKEERTTKPAADRSADEAAIRANIAKFVNAYNAGDAKAVAALFTPDGQIEDKEGNVSEGREAIAQTFAKMFEAEPDKDIEVFVDSIRFLGADLAVEKGTTKEASPHEPPEYDRYTVVHVKRDGKWQMVLARDEEGPADTAYEHLQPLAWLIGEWVDDDGSTTILSTCRWSKDKNFLLQEFKVKVNGREEMDISQRIGWDPLSKRIRSWVFDSTGGYGESFWTRDGNGWIIKATAVRPDGTTASATNRVIPAGPDAYVWRSMDRVVGDDTEAPIEAKVVRKPPQPRD